MAETAAPARKRTPAKKTAPAAAEPVAEAPEPATPAEVELVRTPVQYEPHPDGPTKNFARFNPVADSGCRGTIYVPLGTTEVKTLLISEPE